MNLLNIENKYFIESLSSQDKCFKDSVIYNDGLGSLLSNSKNFSKQEIKDDDYEIFSKIIDLNKKEKDLFKDETYKNIKIDLVNLAKNSRKGNLNYHLNNYNYVSSILRSNEIIKNDFLRDDDIKNLDGGYILEQIPGNKPDKWPEKIDDFLNEIIKKTFNWMFYQPLLINDIFIKKSFNKLEEFYENFDYINYSKVICLLLNLSILSSEMSIFLKIYEKLLSFEIIVNKLDLKIKEEIINILKKYLIPLITDYLLKNAYSEDYPYINDKNPYSAFKSYIDCNCYFNNNYSLTTDGNYLYLYFNTPLSMMYKIGSGKNNTKKGKVYLKKIFDYSEEFGCWVYLKNKLILKSSKSKIGILKVYCPKSLEFLGNISLNIENYYKNNIISLKNKNHKLITDGEYLYTIWIDIDYNNKFLEFGKQMENIDKLYLKKVENPKNNTKKIFKKFLKNLKNPNVEKNNLKNWRLQYNTINFNLLKFEINDDCILNLEVDLDIKYKENDDINELFESFNGIYSFEKCSKVFELSNKNINKAAFNLENKVYDEEKILNPISKTILYQSEIINDIKKNIKFDSISLNKNSLLFFNNIFDLNWYIDNNFVYNNRGHIFLKDSKQLHLLSNYQIFNKKLTIDYFKGVNNKLIEKIINLLRKDIDININKLIKLKNKLVNNLTPSEFENIFKVKLYYGTYITTIKYINRNEFINKSCIYDNIHKEYIWIFPFKKNNDGFINQLYIAYTKPLSFHSSKLSTINDSWYLSNKGKYIFANNKVFNIDFISNSKRKFEKLKYEGIDNKLNEFYNISNINSINNIVTFINNLLFNFAINKYKMPKRINNWIYLYQSFVEKKDLLKKKKYRKYYDKVKNNYEKLYSNSNNLHEFYFNYTLNFEGSSYNFNILLNIYNNSDNKYDILKLIYLWSTNIEKTINKDNIIKLEGLVWDNINSSNLKLKCIALNILFETIELIIDNENLFLKYIEYLFWNINNKLKNGIINMDITLIYKIRNDIICEFDILIFKIIKKIIDIDPNCETLNYFDFNVKFEKEENNFSYKLLDYKNNSILLKEFVNKMLIDNYDSFFNIFLNNYLNSNIHSYYIWKLFYILLVTNFKYLILNDNNIEISNLIQNTANFLLEFFNKIKDNLVKNYENYIKYAFKILNFITNRFISPYFNKNINNNKIFESFFKLIELLKNNLNGFIKNIPDKFDNFFIKNNFEGINFSNSIELNSHHPLERGKTYKFKDIFFKDAIGICIEFDERCKDDINQDVITLKSWYKYNTYKNNSYVNYFNYNSFYGNNINISKKKDLNKMLYMVGDSIEIKMISSPFTVNKKISLNRWGYRIIIRPLYSFNYKKNIENLIKSDSFNNLNKKILRYYLTSIDKIIILSLFNMELFLKGKKWIFTNNLNNNKTDNILKWKIFKHGLINSNIEKYNKDLLKLIYETQDNEINKEKKAENISSKIYYAKIDSFSYISETILEKISMSYKISEKQNNILKTVIEHIINLNDYPITYISEKKRKKFDKDLQNKWFEIEELIIITMLHHLNIIKLIEKNKDFIINDWFDNNLIKDQFNIIKMKFNDILISMVSNLQLEKDYQLLIFDILETIKDTIIKNKKSLKNEIIIENSKKNELKKDKSAKEKILEKFKNSKKNKTYKKIIVNKNENIIEDNNFNIDDFNEFINSNNLKDVISLILNKFFEQDNNKLENILEFKNIDTINNDFIENINKFCDFIKFEILKFKIIIENNNIKIDLENPYIKITNNIREKCNFLLNIIPNCEEIEIKDDFSDLNLSNNPSTIWERSDCFESLELKRTLTDGMSKKNNNLKNYLESFKKIKENNWLYDENPTSDQCNTINLIFTFWNFKKEINISELNKRLIQTCKNSVMRAYGLSKINEFIQVIKNNEEFWTGIFNNNFKSLFDGIENTSYEFKALIIKEANNCLNKLINIVNYKMLQLKKNNNISKINEIRKNIKEDKNFDIIDDICKNYLCINFNILNEIRVLIDHDIILEFNNNIELFIQNLIEFYMITLIDEFISFNYDNYKKIMKNLKNCIVIILNKFMNNKNSKTFINIILKILYKEVGFIYNDKINVDKTILFRIYDPYTLNRVLFLFNMLNDLLDYNNLENQNKDIFILILFLLELESIPSILIINFNKILKNITKKYTFDVKELYFNLINKESNKHEIKICDYNSYFLNKTISNNFYLNYIKNIGKLIYFNDDSDLIKNKKYYMVLHLNEEENIEYLLTTLYYINEIYETYNLPKDLKSYNEFINNNKKFQKQKENKEYNELNYSQVKLNENIFNNIPNNLFNESINEDKLPICWFLNTNNSFNNEKFEIKNKNLEKTWSFTYLNNISKSLSMALKKLIVPQENCTQEELNLFLNNYNLIMKVEYALRDLKKIYYTLNIKNYVILKNHYKNKFSLDDINKISYIFNLGSNNNLKNLSLESYPEEIKNILSKLYIFNHSKDKIYTNLSFSIYNSSQIKKFFSCNNQLNALKDISLMDLTFNANKILNIDNFLDSKNSIKIKVKHSYDFLIYFIENKNKKNEIINLFKILIENYNTFQINDKYLFTGILGLFYKINNLQVFDKVKLKNSDSYYYILETPYLNGKNIYKLISFENNNINSLITDKKKIIEINNTLNIKNFNFEIILDLIFSIISNIDLKNKNNEINNFYIIFSLMNILDQNKGLINIQHKVFNLIKKFEIESHNYKNNELNQTYDSYFDLNIYFKDFNTNPYFPIKIRNFENFDFEIKNENMNENKIDKFTNINSNTSFVNSPSCYINYLPINKQKARTFKIIKYWEKHIFPTMKNYVKGFFSAIENDEFFEKMRIELRNDNHEEATDIAYIICGNRLPPNCHIPSFSYDWSAYSDFELKIGLDVIVNYKCCLKNYNFNYNFNIFDKFKIKKIYGKVLFIYYNNKIALVKIFNPINNVHFISYIPFNYLYPLDFKYNNNNYNLLFEDLVNRNQKLNELSICKIKNQILIKNLKYNKDIDLNKIFNLIDKEISNKLSKKYILDAWKKYNKHKIFNSLEKSEFNSFNELLIEANKFKQIKNQNSTSNLSIIEEFIYDFIDDIDFNNNLIDLIKNNINGMNQFFKNNNYNSNLINDQTLNLVNNENISSNNLNPLNIFKIINNNQDLTYQISSILVNFKDEAFLSMSSVISFYNDNNGINLIKNIETYKTIKNNLSPVLLNTDEAFYSFKTNKEGIPLIVGDNFIPSDLPCGIYAIPTVWNTNLWMIELISYYIFNKLKNNQKLKIVENHLKIYKNIIIILLNLINEFNGPNICYQNIIKLFSIVIIRFKKIMYFNNKILLDKYQSTEILNKFIDESISLNLFKFDKYIESINLFYKKEKLNEKSIYSSFIQDYIEMIVIYLKPIDFKDNKYEIKLNIDNNLILNLSNLLFLMSNLNGFEKNNDSLAEYLKKELNINKYNRFIFNFSGLDNININDFETLFLEIINKHKLKVNNKDLDFYFPVNDKSELIGYGCILFDGLTYMDSNLLFNLTEEMNEKKKIKKKIKNWVCGFCTFLNPSEILNCQMCENPKPQNVQEVDENGIPIEEDEKNNYFNDEFCIENRLKLFIFDLKKWFNIKFKKIINISNNDLTTNEFLEFINIRLSSKEFLDLLEKNKLWIFNTAKNYLEELNIKSENENEFVKNLLSKNPLDIFNILGRLGYDYWLEKSLYGDYYINNKNFNFQDYLLIKEFIDKEISKDSKFSFHFESIFLRNNSINIKTKYNYNEFEINDFKYNKLLNIDLIEIRIILEKIKYFNELLNNNFGFLNLKKEFCDEFLEISDYLNNIKNLIFTENLNHIFNLVMNETSNTGEETPNIYLNRISNISWEKNWKAENTYLYHFCTQLKNISLNLLRPKKPSNNDPFVPFKINYKNENVQGISGPVRQFYADISNELQQSIINSNLDIDNNVLKLLCPTSNNLNNIGDNKDKYTVNPMKNSTIDKKLFFYLGILMGCSFRTGIYLTINLPKLFWKKFTLEKITEEDINEFDKSIQDLFNFFFEYDECIFNEYISQNYTTILSNNKVTEIVENGENLNVSYNNRFDYLKKVLKIRVSEADKQINLIKKGFSKIVPLSIFRIINSKELEIKVSGRNKIDLDLLKKHTIYSNTSTEDDLFFKNFWSIIYNFSEQEKIRLIKFCWGQERLPATDKDFENNQIRFSLSILDFKNKNNDQYLLVADTCFFNLKIPKYSSKEIMKIQIIKSIYIDIDSLNADNEQNNNEMMN